MNNTQLFDELAITKGKLAPFSTTSASISHSTKFIIETTHLSHLNPSTVFDTLFLHQDFIEWKSVLEGKIQNDLSLKFSLSQSRYFFICFGQ